jgi:hypothetical protein
MWILALVPSAAIMLTSLPTLNVVSEKEGYDACIYDCVAVCGTVYTSVRKCEEARARCNKDCVRKYPTQFKGCNKGWKPTAKGCQCIQPLLPNGICPKGPPPIKAQGRVSIPPPIEAQGRVKTGTPGPTLSICEAAGKAKARNSPAAVGLIAKCLGEGGKPIDP